MPSLLRSFFAVIFGYMVMIVAVIPMTLVAVKLFNPHSHTPAYLTYNVTASLLVAFLGGLVTGSIAQRSIVRHGFILALLILSMATLSYRHYQGAQPLWYQITLIILPPFFAVLGAILASRRVRA